MEPEDRDDRLSRISTQWSVVFQAHHGSPEEVSQAQAELMTRYAGAVHRYLLSVLRDEHAAEELDQEFAVRFIRGDFHRADPSRGRFRDFVRRALRNLMIDYQRRRRRVPRQFAADTPEPIDAASQGELDREFLRSWRQELMTRAWDALKDIERVTGRPYYTVLRSRMLHPEKRSHELAEALAVQLDRPGLNASWVRQTLLRARDQFVHRLIAEVAASLPDPGPAEIEAELADLNLLHYCEPVLRRRKDKDRGGPAAPGAVRPRGPRP